MVAAGGSYLSAPTPAFGFGLGSSSIERIEVAVALGTTGALDTTDSSPTHVSCVSGRERASQCRDTLMTYSAFSGRTL